MKNSILSIDNTLRVIDRSISPVKRGLLLVKDCLGYIMYHAVLDESESEVNLSHIRSGMYQIDLIRGEKIISQSILKR